MIRQAGVDRVIPAVASGLMPQLQNAAHSHIDLSAGGIAEGPAIQQQTDDPLVGLHRSDRGGIIDGLEINDPIILIINIKNIIYNELIRRGYSVDVGVVVDRKNGAKIQKEIDFVVNDGDRRIYIQSALQMSDAAKEDSELQSLTLTGDFFKKIVIRMDIPHNYYDDNGIYHCNLIDFLLERVNLF